jgi:hypothetical protein
VSGTKKIFFATSFEELEEGKLKCLDYLLTSSDGGEDLDFNQNN